MVCPNCKNKMTLFGITERGEYKYYCNKCTRIEIERKDKKHE